ncbi:MAG: hypothetical protein AVDCRST_MAG04-2901, partial [uncultured Acetobacteraceae bacterium]
WRAPATLEGASRTEASGTAWQGVVPTGRGRERRWTAWGGA